MSPTLRLISLLILSLFCFISLNITPVKAVEPAASGVAVLVFHQVTPGTASNSVTMTPADFDSTLQSLTEQGYNFIDLQTLHKYLAGIISLPEKSVLITFDDGYQDVYEYAHPLLAKRRIPAVMFPILMYYQDNYRLPQQYTPHLSREDIRAMQDSGLWSFGGHSFDAHRLILTEPDQYGPFYTSYAWLGRRQETHLEYANRIDADLAAMVRTLTALSLPVADFAPPSSAINSTLKETLVQNGIQYIYTQDHQLNYPNSNHIYRITATQPQQVLDDLNALFTPTPAIEPIVELEPEVPANNEQPSNNTDNNPDGLTKP